MRRLFEELEHRISTDPCWAHIDHLAVDGPETHVRSFHGEDIHRPLDTYSLTKPIVTTLIGAVVDDGYLEGIDERVAEILPAAGERHPALTVRHLLTMTASIAADGFMDIDRVMKRESSWVDDILSLPAERAPGSAFKYDNRCAHLTAAVLQRILPQPVVEYARSRLFHPLDISGWTWPTDPEGIPYGFGHFRISPVNLARFGRLWLARGQAKTETLVADRFMGMAWKPASDGGAPEHRPYGFMWWCDGDADPPAWFAAGYAGQLLAVAPSLDAVVVITGSERLLRGDEPSSYELLRQALACSASDVLT